jgi:transposase-like protein
MAKKHKRGVRYTAEKKAAILAAVEQGGLTGDQAVHRFGISKLTFYRWRGPVRSDALGPRGKP